jgi:type I restriction enzyme S subunit
MKRWPKVALGEVLERAVEPAVIDPKSSYHEVTIKLWGRGVVSRGLVRGGDVVSNRQFVRANQLILSKIDARNGAIGLVPPQLDGAIVSNDFPSFRVADQSRCDVRFLGWLARSAPFVELCKAASEGTTNRVRIKEDRFLAQSVRLPSVEEQATIVARLDALEARTRQIAEHLDAAERAGLAHLSAVAKGSGRESTKGWRFATVADVAFECKNPEKVVAAKTYPNVGILSYAKGLFQKAPIDGAVTSAQTLYRIRAGQFIYSRLFAFEGAYALVPDVFDGYYVSNEFPTFSIDSEQASAKYLMTLFLTEEDWMEMRASTKGVGDRRLRIQPEQLLSRKIFLPPRHHIEVVDKLFDNLTLLKAKHTAIREANAALIPATLERLFAEHG